MIEFTWYNSSDEERGRKLSECSLDSQSSDVGYEEENIAERIFELEYELKHNYSQDTLS
jgi:hypothetical protein